MAIRYSVPLPGPFYYSGRVGPGTGFLVVVTLALVPWASW